MAKKRTRSPKRDLINEKGVSRVHSGCNSFKLHLRHVCLLSACQISDDLITIDLDEAMELEDNSDEVVNSCLEDYPLIVDDSPEGRYAAEVTRAHITEQTREGHIRCVLSTPFLCS